MGELVKMSDIKANLNAINLADEDVIEEVREFAGDDTPTILAIMQYASSGINELIEECDKAEDHREEVDAIKGLADLFNGVLKPIGQFRWSDYVDTIALVSKYLDAPEPDEN